MSSQDTRKWKRNDRLRRLETVPSSSNSEDIDASIEDIANRKPSSVIFMPQTKEDLEYANAIWEELNRNSSKPVEIKKKKKIKKEEEQVKVKEEPNSAEWDFKPKTDDIKEENIRYFRGNVDE